MTRPILPLPGLIVILSLAMVGPTDEVAAQQGTLPRLPASEFDVSPPTSRVTGTPGTLTLRSEPCRADVSDSELRRRIVDVAAQEWAYFGFPVFDESIPPGPGPQVNGAAPPFSRPGAEEVLRTAGSVAGYWAVTPEGAWIVDRQNDAWNGSRSVNRWLNPWSAAFISWVMCEAGLGTADRFRRAVAHHSYIDQAIRARDGRAPGAAFVAFDIGERTLAPGDLLCSGRRPAYRTIAERRRNMGTGAQSHCDVVVAVDDARARILTIGGNVRGSVGLKIFPAQRSAEGVLHPVRQPPGAGSRVLFAHLRLGSEPIGNDAFRETPTMRSLQDCRHPVSPPSHLLAHALVEITAVPMRC